jgi:glycosyltransferase involved in cell wall biosynthesis
MIQSTVPSRTVKPSGPTERTGGDSRKRLLFVGHSAYQGGAELCLDTILRHIDRTRYDVYTVFPWRGPLTESTLQLGIPVEIIPITWWMNWPLSFWYYKNLIGRSMWNVVRLVNFIKRHQIDLVYTNTVSIWESALASRLAGVRHIWHCHEVLGPGSTKHHILPMWLHYQLIGRLSHRIIFESESSKKACACFKDNPKSAVVYNSLRFSSEVLGASCIGDRQKLGLREGDRVVAFVGQFCERKNPSAVLRAVARIRKLEGLRCLLVGSGPLRGSLEKEIRALGLERICSVLDFQPDVSGLMRSIDLLVLPSREESFGLVLVEAGAFAKPVIATRTQGPAEIVVDGETGYLVEVDDDAQMADKMAALLSSDSERRRMGSAGLRRARELFCAEENTRKIQQLIDDVLK